MNYKRTRDEQTGGAALSTHTWKYILSTRHLKLLDEYFIIRSEILVGILIASPQIRRTERSEYGKWTRIYKSFSKMRRKLFQVTTKVKSLTFCVSFLQNAQLFIRQRT